MLLKIIRFLRNQIYMQNTLIQSKGQEDLEERIKITYQSQYGSNFDYLCAVIGFAVGYGSFWRFPYLVYKLGFQFVLIYFFILMLFGLPILYLQTGLGQIHQESIPFIFMRINKGLKFLGLTFVAICFHFTGYYNIILAYSYRFVLSVFDSDIRFQDQSIRDNKIFAENILHSSSSINHFEQINYTLFFFYLMSIVICYFVISKGVKHSSKVIVFSAIFPYFLFTVMLVRGIFLPGALDGLKLLLQFRGNILSLTLWFQAIIQVFYQLTLACSGIVHMSSMKPKSQPFLNGLYLILVSVLVCGLLCATNIFLYLGHFAYQIGVSIDEITLSGPQICFNIFPKALAILPFPRIWLFLFFVTMVLLGLDTMFGGMETIVCYLKDQAKIKLILFGRKITFHQMKIALGVSYVLFILPLTSSAGIHYLLFFDRFFAYIPLALNISIQIYFFVYKFKFQELQYQIEKYTGTKTPAYVKFFLKSKILIAILGINLILTIFNQSFVFYQEYTFNYYILGWCLTVYPYVFAYYYWHNNKQDCFRLTFRQIQSTYTTIEHHQRASNISDSNNQCEMNNLQIKQILQQERE